MLKRLEIVGFKSFAKKTVLDFSSATTAVVGPNGSGKSNVAEAFRFALGEQSMKSMRGKRAEDLIWGGSHSMPRANRAAVVIVFDNSRREFKIDFDEVAIERVVFRDGTSEYSINGSRVRLRDIEELLAGANIGETGHHIISQGEADRILLASNKDRRAMLEDALGLKIFEFKKQEAQRKLEKTEENIAQVNSLRRELAPHLRFLESQVKKLERADSLRVELISLSQTYFAVEDAYIAHEKKKVEGEKRDALERLAVASAELDRVADPTSADHETVQRTEALRKAEREVSELSSVRANLSREIGRVEGALTEVKRRAAAVLREPYAKVPREELEALRDEVERQADAVSNGSIDALKAALEAIRVAVKLFFTRHGVPRDEYFSEEEDAAVRLENERAALAEKYASASAELEKAESARARAREGMVALEETGREIRHRILESAQSKAHEESEIAKAEAREFELSMLSEALERDKSEVLVLGGTAALSYAALEQVPTEERRVQEDHKRTLERTKIRLEEAGGTGEEIRQEHKEVSEREAFLATELEDLAKSAAGLGALIHDLDEELAKHFSEGLVKVNTSFSDYFALMFGGGSARLTLEEPDEPEERDELSEEDVEDMPKEKERPGIEIAVNLPKKKVRSLIQLSGGERALTSIALIFAMSQVNPPPFLILDETDAALDEANSRRYGDMIENLAKKSQLIVITHNRETMSRTSILYGVTMGGDGVSKLLSVKFDEAVAVAK
jgi:chromosome segregation protein